MKTKKIMKNYDIILALKSWISVKLAINQPEKVEVIPEVNAEPEPPAKQAKGKKK